MYSNYTSILYSAICDCKGMLRHPDELILQFITCQSSSARQYYKYAVMKPKVRFKRRSLRAQKTFDAAAASHLKLINHNHMKIWLGPPLKCGIYAFNIYVTFSRKLSALLLFFCTEFMIFKADRWKMTKWSIDNLSSSSSLPSLSLSSNFIASHRLMSGTGVQCHEYSKLLETIYNQVLCKLTSVFCFQRQIIHH